MTKSVDSKDCRICAIGIPASAKKCTHCQGFQGRFRGILNIGVPTMALLVAFVTVLGHAIPMISTALESPRDDLRLRVVTFDAESNRIELFVSNLGRRPGALSSALLRVPPEAAALTTVPAIRLTLESTTRLISPGDSKIVELHAPAGVLPRKPGILERPLRYTLDVELIRFDGSLRVRPLILEAIP